MFATAFHIHLLLPVHVAVAVWSAEVMTQVLDPTVKEPAVSPKMKPKEGGEVPGSPTLAPASPKLAPSSPKLAPASPAKTSSKKK